MSNPSIAEWIKKEHDEVEHLAGKLRESVSFAPRVCTEAWLANVRDRFEHLRAHLQKHMALEEAGGYMAAVVERHPWLSNRVNQLAGEHRDFAKLLSDLHDSLDWMDSDRRLLIRDFCYRVHDLLGYIERHEQEANDLVEFALTDDVGIKD